MIRIGWLSVLIMVAGLAYAQNAPATIGKSTRFGHIDGGTLPTPCVGCVVFDTEQQQLLVSDGGLWAPAATSFVLSVDTARGLTWDGGQLNVNYATVSTPGTVSTTTQTFAGTKSFDTINISANAIPSLSSAAIGAVTSSYFDAAAVYAYSFGARAITSFSTAANVGCYSQNNCLVSDSTSYILRLKQTFTSSGDVNAQVFAPVGTAPHPTIDRRIATTFFASGATTQTDNMWGTAPAITDAAAASANTGDSTRYFRDLNTAASTNSISFIIGSTSDPTRRNYGGRFNISFRTGSSISNARVWLGFTDRTGAQMAAQNPASANICAFRWDTSDSASFVKAVSKDGTTLASGNATNPAINTSYTVRIEMTTTSCTFWWNGVYVAQRTANLPVATTDLVPFASIETLENVAKSIGINHLSMETR